MLHGRLPESALNFIAMEEKFMVTHPKTEWIEGIRENTRITSSGRASRDNFSKTYRRSWQNCVGRTQILMVMQCLGRRYRYPENTSSLMSTHLGKSNFQTQTWPCKAHEKRNARKYIIRVALNVFVAYLRLCRLLICRGRGRCCWPWIPTSPTTSFVFLPMFSVNI